MENKKNISWDTVCLTIIALSSVTLALVYLKAILIPFAIALFLYFLVSHVIDRLQARLNMKAPWSTILTIMSAILVSGVILSSFFISIKLFIPDAGAYQSKLHDLSVSIKVLLEKNDIQIGRDLILNHLSALPFGAVLKNLTGSLVGFLGNSLLVVVVLIFLMESRSDTKKEKNNRISGATIKINQYVRTKFLTSLATGFSVWLVFASLGLNLAGMFGVLTFLLNFIPSIGSLVAVLLPLPILLLDFGFGVKAIIGIVIPSIIQFGVGNVLEPKLMGDTLDLHPVTQLFALLFWGAIWGVAGMFLAVPIVVIIKLFLEQFDQTKVLAHVLAGRIDVSE